MKLSASLLKLSFLSEFIGRQHSYQAKSMNFEAKRNFLCNHGSLTYLMCDLKQVSHSLDLFFFICEMGSIMSTFWRYYEDAILKYGM